MLTNAEGSVSRTEGRWASRYDRTGVVIVCVCVCGGGEEGIYGIMFVTCREHAISSYNPEF